MSQICKHMDADVDAGVDVDEQNTQPSAVMKQDGKIT